MNNGAVLNRNISALSEREFDLVIVGGGIFGVCAAWDAALRGLSVALVEKGDFCHATSASHYKIVHGGIRYLQHADVYRIRESSRERSILLRIAPQLVRPLPIVVPTYGHGMQGKEMFRAALLLYDLIVADRNRGLKDPDRRIPSGHLLSREECLKLFPGLQKKGLTGAALFYDGQIYNPPRLGVSYLRSAACAGAFVANYLKVTKFLRQRNRVLGVGVRDLLTGDELEIHSKVVLNAAGPWAERVLATLMAPGLRPKGTYSRDTCFVVGRRLTGDYALALQARTKDPDAIVSRGTRHLFVSPWRDYTLVGVWHVVVHDGAPEHITVTEEELQEFLSEINSAYPAFALELKDISMWNAGLVVFGDNKPGATDLSYGKRSRLIDHAIEHNLQGLITMIGVRATTSRGVAQKAIDMVFRKLGKNVSKSVTAVTPIYGGEIEYFKKFLQQAVIQRPPTISREVICSLVHNYGSAYRQVLKYINEDSSLSDTIGTSNVIKAEVAHAVREEMAQKLEDVVFRRTDLGTGEYPGDVALQTCAHLMAGEMGWDKSRIAIELEQVKNHFPCHIRSSTRVTTDDIRRRSRAGRE